MNVSWMGRPEGGMRGLERGQSPTLFNRSYEYADNANSLKAVPIPVWSVKTLTARWQTPLRKDRALIESRLERRPLTIDGSIIVSPDFPWTLHRCQLFYFDQGWDLGTVRPGQTIELGRIGVVSLPNLFSGYLAPSGEAAGAHHVYNDLMRDILFHDAIPPRLRARSEYLDYLDQSWRLLGQFPEAILFGHVEMADGRTEEINNGPTPACRLKPFSQGLGGTMRQTTLVRAFLPVEKGKGSE